MKREHPDYPIGLRVTVKVGDGAEMEGFVSNVNFRQKIPVVSAVCFDKTTAPETLRVFYWRIEADGTLTPVKRRQSDWKFVPVEGSAARITGTLPPREYPTRPPGPVRIGVTKFEDIVSKGK